MKYNKILDVSEDNERVYFSFYIDNYNQRIFGIPKHDCSNKAIYVGTSFDCLSITDSDKAKQLLTELMKRAILTHPNASLCNKETLRLIE